VFVSPLKRAHRTCKLAGFGDRAVSVADLTEWDYGRYEGLRTDRALDLIRSGAFDRGEPGVFGPMVDSLLAHGDHYMHLADLASYVKIQEQAGALYRQLDAWARRAIVDVGRSGKFSSQGQAHLDAIVNEAQDIVSHALKHD